MFKELKSVWADYRSYNSSNTILVDDSPYKSFINSVSIPCKTCFWHLCFYSSSDEAVTFFHSSFMQPYNAIFPSSYTSPNAADNYLGQLDFRFNNVYGYTYRKLFRVPESLCFADPEGGFVEYLKKLADAQNVQQFIKDNAFGQSPIAEGSADCKFYTEVVSKLGLEKPSLDQLKRKREPPKRYTPEVGMGYMFSKCFAEQECTVYIS